MEAATMAPPVEETRIIGHDKEFATIVERAGTGGKLIVLTGRVGIGKSVTAQLLAKHQSVGDIIEIEARAEFTELTLIEAVAKRVTQRSFMPTTKVIHFYRSRSPRGARWRSMSWLPKRQR